MKKTTLAVAVLALAATGLEQQRTVASLKEERITIEYTVTSSEAVIIVEAESEQSLELIQVRNPIGIPLIAMRSQSGHGMSLSGFIVETFETDLETLFTTYGEGRYPVQALTTDGIPLQGVALLRHEMCSAPVVLTPTEDALVAHDEVLVTWLPDPRATGYRVVLEQGENDTLVVTLPAEVTTFRVPVGVLAPGLESHVEVGAIAPTGNCTLVEVAFTTL